jgi:hypothetical protein
MSQDRWVQASMESFEMGERIRTAISASYRMHLWAMEVLRKNWVETMQVPTINELQPMMTYWIREQGLEEVAQRYAMDAALSRTALHFNDQLRTVETTVLHGEIVVSVRIPEPIAEKTWTTLEIQSRTIWRKYLEDYGRLTTAYGTVFLEGDWPEQMRGYAEDLGVGLDWLPAIWQSVTLKEGVIEEDTVDEDQELWLIRFNFFKPDSHAAKKRTKKGRLYAEK